MPPSLNGESGVIDEHYSSVVNGSETVEMAQPTFDPEKGWDDDKATSASVSQHSSDETVSQLSGDETVPSAKNPLINSTSQLDPFVPALCLPELLS
jgi:hypothetical protein